MTYCKHFDNSCYHHQLQYTHQLQCTDDDTRSHRNVCNMSFVSILLWPRFSLYGYLVLPLFVYHVKSARKESFCVCYFKHWFVYRFDFHISLRNRNEVVRQMQQWSNHKMKFVSRCHGEGLYVALKRHACGHQINLRWGVSSNV